MTLDTMLGFEILFNVLLDQPFLTIHCPQGLRLWNNHVNNFFELFFELVISFSLVSKSPSL